MSRNHGLGRVLLALALAGACGLAGCGKQGVLKQPPPLFGAKAQADYDAQRAKEQAQEDKDDAQRRDQLQRQDPNAQSAGDNAPKTKRDIQDPAQKLTPASQAPVTGAPNLGGPPVQAAPAY